MGPKPSPHSEVQSKECKCKLRIIFNPDMLPATGEVSTWTSCPFWNRSDDMGYMAMTFRNLVFRRDSTITFCEIYKSNVPKQFTTEPQSFPDLEQKEAGCLRLEAIAGGWNAGLWKGQFSMKMWDVVGCCYWNMASFWEMWDSASDPSSPGSPRPCPTARGCSFVSRTFEKKRMIW